MIPTNAFLKQINPVYSSALPRKGAGGSPRGDYSAPPGNARENGQRAEPRKKDVLSGERQGLKHHPVQEIPAKANFEGEFHENRLRSFSDARQFEAYAFLKLILRKVVVIEQSEEEILKCKLSGL